MRRDQQAGEALTCALEGDANLRLLRVLLLESRLGEIEARKLAESVGVLRSQHDDPLLSGDRLVGLSVGLQRRRELAPRFHVLRVLLGLLLGARDRRNAARAAVPPEDVPHAGAAGPDPEEDETAAERDGEEDEHPLRVAP